jgi:hypothetical protein
VGASNDDSNQARTAGPKGASGSAIDAVATGFGSIGRPAQFDHPFEFR